MEFRALGPLEVMHCGRPVPMTSGVQRRILATLLAHRGTRVSTDRLIDVVWGASPPPSARASLHSHVSRLRRRVDDERRARLRTCPGGYVLDVDDADVDVERFERLVQEARAIADEDPRHCAEALQRALHLWRGRPFDEVAEHESVMAEVVRLEELRLGAAEDYADARLAAGDHAEVLPELEAAVARYPLRERRQAQLMLALYRCARTPDALAVYQSYRRELADELGLDPSPALQELERDILQENGDLAVEGREAPNPRRGWRTRSPVPQEPTRLVGREEEALAVERLLQRCRVVTLTGVGGVGKTRLAEHVAHRVQDSYSQGVHLCELAVVSSNGEVEHAVAEALGVRRQGGRSTADAIVDALQADQAMLLADNCEHVVAGAAALITRLVRDCPALTVLATSRERLAVPGEHLFAVPPLATTGNGQTGKKPPAVELFLERLSALSPQVAKSVEPDTASELCRRLDGIPLAIELAAGRARAIHPAELLERLDQRFGVLTGGPRSNAGRHRTLSAVVEWSYSLLSDTQARLFERLSVFRGGFTLGTAEAICGHGEVDAAEVSELVADLVDRSLVIVDGRQTPCRYRLLETLRQYGALRLEEREESEDLRARHARVLLDLAEHADGQLRGPDEARWVRVVGDELDNLRAAHLWACESGDVDLAMRLSAALHCYATDRLSDEVFEWGARALELSGARSHRLFPFVSGSVARGVSNRGDLARATALAEDALGAAAGEHDRGRQVALHALSAIRLYEGQLEDCMGMAKEEAGLARRSGDLVAETRAELHQVLALTYAGDSEASLPMADSALELAEETQVPDLIAWALYASGEARLYAAPQRACELLERSIRVARSVHNRFAEGVALASLTSVRARHGPAEAALEQFRQVIQHWRRTGDWTHQWTTMRSLVQLLTRLHCHEAAAVLHGAVTASPTATPVYGADHERLAVVARGLSTDLGPDRFETAFEAGAALPREVVIARALDAIDEAIAFA